MSRRCLAVLLLLGPVACDLERTVGLSSAPDDTRMTSRQIEFSSHDQVDLLLVLDDSGSMAEKQAKLRAELPRMISALHDQIVGLNLHLGVTTTDLGAPGITCGRASGGKLSAVGAGADASCRGPVGTSWLTISPEGDNISPGDALEDTIACMTAVGDEGCGFEMPLESALRLLTQPIPDDVGFIRDSALLAVLILTDEDDCSVGPSSDLFAADPLYGPLTSYRCARFGVFCDGGMLLDTPSGYTSCRPATAADGGKLLDPARYLTAFGASSSEGGIKANPADLIVAALRAPAAPFATELAFDSSLCGPGVTACTLDAHSCADPDDLAFFGDPAVRIESVVGALGGVLRSICEPSYQPFVTDLANRISTAAAGEACIPGALADVAHPSCVIRMGATQVPSCKDDPTASPCWVVKIAPDCPAQLDPLTGDTQRLHVDIVGTASEALEGSCQVLAPG